MYQAYRTIKPFDDEKEWLPFAGETVEGCRQAAAVGGLKDYNLVYIAQIDRQFPAGLHLLPANAKFMGKL